MQYTITLNKSGYEPFLDFLKAYSILCVLFGHTFPYLKESGYSLWYGMQVPMFVLVQVFHVFKKDYYKFDVRKTLKRILYPFLIIQIIPIILTICSRDNDCIINYIMRGGYGPGAYYPWIYLQLAVFLACVKPWFDKGSKVQKLIASLIACEALEIIASLIGLPDWLYRLLAIRYFFLVYLGWIWVKDGIVLNSKTITLSILSMGAVIYFDYLYKPLEPWFYDTVWRCHRWPCYFYVSCLLSGILYLVYNKTIGIQMVSSAIKMLSKCSYEIFLVQMIIIPFMSQIDFTKNIYISFGIRSSLIFIISIVGGYYFNLVYTKIGSKIRS